MRKGWVTATVAAAVFMSGMMVAQQVNGQAQVAAVYASAAAIEDAPIPNNAIRLRIIANSDSAEDQQLKREIRDRVIAEVAEHLRGVEGEAAARQKVAEIVPQMNALAEQVIREKGFNYVASTDYGMVPFPTKLYGSQVYPAGEYEALRIQIGEAQGQNWWCVLFPPLCFVDAANGDAVAQPQDMEAAPPSDPVATVDVPNADSGETEEVEVRFGLWDKVCEFFDSIFG